MFLLHAVESCSRIIIISTSSTAGSKSFTDASNFSRPFACLFITSPFPTSCFENEPCRPDLDCPLVPDLNTVSPGYKNSKSSDHVTWQFLFLRAFWYHTTSIDEDEAGFEPDFLRELLFLGNSRSFSASSWQLWFVLRSWIRPSGSFLGVVYLLSLPDKEYASFARFSITQSATSFLEVSSGFSTEIPFWMASLRTSWPSILTFSHWTSFS